MTEFAPVGKLAVEKLADPRAEAPAVAAVPSKGAAPRVVEPFWNVTVPVGATPKLSAERVTLRISVLPTMKSGS